MIHDECAAASALRTQPARKRTVEDPSRDPGVDRLEGCGGALDRLERAVHDASVVGA